MAQQQLKYFPVLKVQVIRHLSDDKERIEQTLPDSNLDISWLADKTEQDVTEALYAATEKDGAKQLSDCINTIKSRRKHLKQLVTYYVLYVADCGYLTGRRDIVIEHLKLCHNRIGSITQVDKASLLYQRFVLLYL